MAVNDIVMGAAGASGPATFVEDVFSTWLYAGNGSTQGINNGIALGDFGVGTSTQFNGTSDYLSRSTDLNGNTDGKTFTLSCWVYLPPKLDSNQRMIYATDSSDNGIMIYIQEFNTIGIEAWNGGVRTLQAATTTAIGTQVWTNIIISIDTANTSNRYVYFNNVAASVTWSTYNNANIEFTRPTHYVGAWGNGTRKFYGNFAHLYLDYTYRNLSIESNRRIFIDANGGSTSESSLSALTPILYLPMTATYSIGSNLGTGGVFTINGSPRIVQSGTQYVAGSGKGGLVWIKGRNQAWNNYFYDTNRGVNKWITSNDTNAQSTDSGNLGVSAFNTSGFSLGDSNGINNLSLASTYASWTFREQPKFFDVVTYTGTGANRTIAHSLGSVPGMIIVKSTSDVANWRVYHRALGATKYITLDTTTEAFTNSTLWNDTEPTSSVFTVGTTGSVNANGSTFVAYLFAHNAGGFGLSGNDNVISCGSLTTDSGGLATVSLGYEPQWLMIKRTATSGDWQIVDNMRGFVNNSSGGDAVLKANSSDAESTFTLATPTSTGFLIDGNVANTPIIYIAIRRPMKTPTTGTEVFSPNTTAATTGTPINIGFAPDMMMQAARTLNYANNTEIVDRLRGVNTNGVVASNTRYLVTSSTSAEVISSNATNYWRNTGYNLPGEWADISSIYYAFRRASGFFDVVCYTGDSSGTKAITHNLGVAPELYIVKGRTGSPTYGWYVYSAALGNTKSLVLNTTAAEATTSWTWGNTSPTSSAFYVTSDDTVGGAGRTYVAYLFASCPGVSKVGSYTGTGTTQQINCGFTSGARFVLIKRTDSTGDWYVWDSARGIVAGNDPHLSLNTTAAEVTTDDSVDADSSGFIVNQLAATNINVNAAAYIYLAIA